MDKILQFKLRTWSRLILRKYQPTVIAIVDSENKVDVKEAIAFVSRDAAPARIDRNNHRDESDFLLAIIGSPNPRNLGGWFLVLLRAAGLFLFKNKNYPRVLILEIDVSQIENLENFIKDMASKIEFIKINEKTREVDSSNKARKLSYGLEEGVDLRAQDIVYNFTKGTYELSGLNFKLNYRGSIVPVFMDNIMSESVLCAALAAAAVGIYFEMNLVEIAQALRDYALPKGKMNVLPGIKHTFIIDDTYDSAPEEALDALDTLRRVKVDELASKYAVLGDMIGLGNKTEEEHQRLGAKIAVSGVDYLIAVGEKARDIIRGATEAGLADDYIFHFDYAAEVGNFLKNRLKAGDVVLIKGSRGMEMEKIVEEIMAEPNRAGELLVN